MWEKVKNLDLFIRVIDTLHNNYVCFPRQYHRDYNSFVLSFSFEDWSNFYSDGKKHITITAEYTNAKGQFLVKFQDEDFDKLCEMVKIWNESHRVELTADIMTKICAEQNSQQNKVDYVPVNNPTDTTSDDADKQNKKTSSGGILCRFCNLIVKHLKKIIVWHAFCSSECVNKINR